MKYETARERERYLLYLFLVSLLLSMCMLILLRIIIIICMHRPLYRYLTAATTTHKIKITKTIHP